MYEKTELSILLIFLKYNQNNYNSKFIDIKNHSKINWFL